MKKLISILGVIIVLMLLPVNASAAESEELNEELNVYSEVYSDIYYDRHSFIISAYDSDLGGYVDVLLTMVYEMSYSYDEGCWSDINYLSMVTEYIAYDYVEVNSRFIHNHAYIVGDNSAYRTFGLFDNIEIKVGIEVDEYGEVYVYAYQI